MERSLLGTRPSAPVRVRPPSLARAIARERAIAVSRVGHALGEPVVARFPVKPRQRDLRDPPDVVDCRPDFVLPMSGLGELGV
jgi:hypothetical protein